MYTYTLLLLEKGIRSGATKHRLSCQGPDTLSYANYPVIWCSKLQTEIVLSTTESEYIALSQLLRDSLPLTDFFKKIREIIPSDEKRPEVHCTIFEDNKNVIDLVKAPRIRSRTKHIALKYHHFRSSVKNKLVSIRCVEIRDQIADNFTKALNNDQFYKLRKMLNGW